MSTLELSSPPWIVGHRGAAGEALENTLVAFRRGVEAGANMIELDVQLTADGVLVCFHDWNLLRLAGRTEIVEKESSDRLTEIALGPNGDRMPTLSDALGEIPETTALNVEIKRRLAPSADLVRSVSSALDGRSQVLVSSFDWDLLSLLRARAPELLMAPLSPSRERRALAEDPVGDLIAAGESLGAFSLHCSRSMVEPGLVERAAARGFDRLLSYTVNDPAEAEALFLAGFSGIFTDVPTAMVERFHPEWHTRRAHDGDGERSG